MNTMPSFCTNCGRALNPGTRFCGQCGQSVQPLPAAPMAPAPMAPAPMAPAPPPAAQSVVPPPTPPMQPAPAVGYPPAPAANVEPILGVIPGLQYSQGFLGLKVQTLSMVITPVRLVLVPISNREMNQAVLAARAEAKAQGKGFFGQVGAQLGWMELLCRQYQSMSVQAILAQYPGSFFIANAQVSRVRFKEASIDSDDGTQSPAEMRLDAASKYRFVMRGTSARDARHLMQQALGAVVR